MLNCSKFIGQNHVLSTRNQDHFKWARVHQICRTFFKSNDKSKDCDGKKKKECETVKTICPDKKSQSKILIEKFEVECKRYTPPVYDKCFKQGYEDPCKNEIKTNFSPQYPIPVPCREAIPSVDDKLDLDCPYEKEKGSFFSKLKKIILFATPFIVGYITYNQYSTPEKKDEVKHVVRTKKRCVVSQPIIKDPLESDLIPSDIKYLIIGGGTAAYSAFNAIQNNEPKAKVLVVAKEPYEPYIRPPLSKTLFSQEDREAAKQLIFTWDGQNKSVFFEPTDYYAPLSKLKESEDGAVSLIKGWEITKVDVVKKEATLDDGKVIKYNKCLIATGGKPKNLSIFENADEEIKEKITLFRGINDFKKIEEIFNICEPSSIAIIGGGLLGSELATHLSKRGENNNVQIKQIVKGPGPMDKILPSYLSRWATQKIADEGVDIITDTEVDDVMFEDEQLKLVLSNDQTVIADHVIIAIGITPNTDFAEQSGLEIDKKRGGYLVNPHMLARENLYVAGDCASYYDEKLGRRRREEHHENSLITGRIAGENMTGKETYYDSQYMYRGGIGQSIKFEGVGIVDATLPTVSVFAKPDNAPAKQDVAEYTKGVIFYLKNEIVIGIVLWNIKDKMNIAKQLLEEKKYYKDLNDVAKLFDIHGGGELESSAR